MITENSKEATNSSSQKEKKESTIKPRTQPDFNNPNNYCAVCQLGYSSRTIYLIHLSQTHYIEEDPSGLSIHTEALTYNVPDALDHVSCETTLASHSSPLHKTKEVDSTNELQQQNIVSSTNNSSLYSINKQEIQDKAAVFNKNDQFGNENSASGSTCQALVTNKPIPQQLSQGSHNIIQQNCANNGLPVSRCDLYNTSCPSQAEVSAILNQVYQIPRSTLKGCKKKKSMVKKEPPKLISCQVCDTTNSSIYKNTRHLKLAHGVIQKVLVLSCQPNHDIQPDTNDLNTVYCKSCNHQFESTNIYRKHLIDLHQLKLEPISEDDVTIFGWYELDNQDYAYCKVCKHRFASHRGLSIHLFSFHDVDLKNRKSVIQQEL